MKIKNIQKNRGAAMMIVVFFFMFISLTILIGIITPVVREFKIVGVNLNSKQAYFLAESGTEDAFYRIKNNQTIGTSETLTLGSGSETTTIATLVGNNKQITSLGDFSTYQRKVSLMLTQGEGAVFKYGTQAGQGGFVFQENSFVRGSLYSNGNIVGSNGAYITGDAFVAGTTGSISNMCVGGTAQGSSCSGASVGDAHAHTVTNSTVTGVIYCQSGSNNNTSCNTSQTDPVEEPLPISDSDITTWETDAADTAHGGTTITGNVTISTPTTMGLKKIVGNLTISDILTITNTIYVTGNVIINTVSGGGSTTLPSIKLDSSYGATSAIIIADGYIIVNNGVAFQNSGTAGSYILLLSNSTCDESVSTSPCFGHNAIDVSNNSDISIVNAQKGTVYFSNNASVKESVGKKIVLKNNVGVSYGSGVINVGFTSGPSGSWNLDSWKETQ